MRTPSFSVASLLIPFFMALLSPNVSAQAEIFPPHPLWPDQRLEKPETCEMKFPPGVDASLWNTNLWPGGVVPYTIDGGVTQENRDRLRIAMDELQTVSGVTFVPRTSQPNYIRIQNGGGNNSFVGQIGGAQTINLVSWGSRYVIIHELMHALGVWHEQNRADRDTYVIINPANIQPQYYNPNFTVQNGATPTGAYDFESIMHYDACSFSTCCAVGTTCACPVSCRSIDVQPAYAQFADVLGNRSSLSNGDKSGLVSRYGNPPDDALEDNDSIANAQPISPSTYSLRLTDTNDYFSIDVPGSGPLGVTMTAPLWSASNATVSILTPAGSVLATGTPIDSDSDSDGDYEVYIAAQVNPGTAIIRVNRVQPWGGAYQLNVVAACVPEPWKQVVAGVGPSARGGHVMAFDSSAGEAIMFGGRTNSGLSNETWAWDGQAWFQRSPATSPNQRIGAVACFDESRGRVVLFGGYDINNDVRNDTWEWHQGNWTQRTTATVPTPRHSAAMSYDAARSRVVMFGGYDSANNAYLQDLWEYDGTNWTLRANSGPSARLGPAMCYDSARGRTLMFGGANGSGPLGGQTWAWNGDTGAWNVVTSFGAPSWYYHQMAYDPQRDRCVSVGGRIASGVSGEQWEFDGVSWSLVPVVAPRARRDYSLNWDSAAQRMLLFAGVNSDEDRMQDLWQFVGGNWLPIAGTQTPGSRARASMAGDERLGGALLFGGERASDNTVYGDTWILSNGVWGHYAPSGAPLTARASYAMAYDSIRGKTVLYGGATFSTIHASTFEFGPTGWTEPLTVVHPGQRYGAAMAFDAARGECVLYGGQFSGGLPTSTWKWNGTAWSQAAAVGPGPRHLPSMAYDPIRQRVVLFGGYGTSGQPFNETWLWDGSVWSQVPGPAPTGLTARYGAGMAFDPERGAIILSSGTTGTQLLDDTWQWDGVQWTQIEAGMLPTRNTFAMSIDPASQTLNAYGGFAVPSTGVDRSDTWRFDSVADAPIFTAQPQNATINFETQALFNAPATDVGNFAYRWYATTNNAGVQGSVALNDLDRGGRILGVFTSQLRINSAQSPDATTQPVPGVFVNQYFCVVSNACQSATSNPATLTVNVPPPLCVGDLTGDGVVNVVDLTIFLGAFGTTVPVGTGADLDANGVVNVIDLTIFLGRFGQTCP